MAQTKDETPCTPEQYPFLGLRWPCPMEYRGLEWPSAENAWQSTRFQDKKVSEKFRFMAPESAAYRGAAWRTTVPDWDERRMDFLYEVLLAKFRPPHMRALLLSTGSRPIAITNRRHDNALGACLCPMCRGKGANALGRLLEQAREALA